MAQPLIFRWQQAIRDAEMPVARKGFALLLSTYADADGTNCFPSIATLMAHGFAKRTVQRNLRTLEADGWLEIQHGGGRRANGSYSHNRYRLRLPANGFPDDTPKTDGAGSLVARSGFPDGAERCHLGTPTNPSTSPTTNRARAARAAEEEASTTSTMSTTSTTSALREQASAAGLDEALLLDVVYDVTGKHGTSAVESLDATETELVTKAVAKLAAEIEIRA